MNGAGERDRMNQPSAHDVGAQAAAWLERREQGNWGEQDQIVFDAWLDESLRTRPLIGALPKRGPAPTGCACWFTRMRAPMHPRPGRDGR